MATIKVLHDLKIVVNAGKQNARLVEGKKGDIITGIRTDNAEQLIAAGFAEIWDGIFPTGPPVDPI